MKTNDPIFPPNSSGPGKRPCHCRDEDHPTHGKYIALTGGPGAGKTAVLNLLRESLCHHVEILKESAGILFGGGFPRRESITAMKAAQRAIFHVQSELEWLVDAEDHTSLILCDRGTLDALAYWPDTDESFFEDVKTTKEEQLARYHTVIHLRTPPPMLYNNHNPLRIESATEASRIDKDIAAAWEGHPRRVFVESHDNFLIKAREAINLILPEAPPCCRIDRQV